MLLDKLFDSATYLLPSMNEDEQLQLALRESARLQPQPQPQPQRLSQPLRPMVVPFVSTPAGMPAGMSAGPTGTELALRSTHLDLAPAPAAAGQLEGHSTGLLGKRKHIANSTAFESKGTLNWNDFRKTVKKMGLTQEQQKEAYKLQKTSASFKVLKFNGIQFQ